MNLVKKMRYGLDFGTSNTLISILMENEVKVLPIGHGGLSPILESAVYFKDDLILFGSEAIEKYISDISSFRLASSTSMSESDFYTDQSSEIVPGRLIRSFKSSLAKNKISTRIGNNLYTVDDIITLFLKEVKRRADEAIGFTVDDVTIGRPVKYVGENDNSSLIQGRMEQCLHNAGFKNVKFELEPVAAARNYSQTSSEIVMIFDFGGGTLDTSVVDLKTNTVLSTNGLSLGGDNLDYKIYRSYFSKYFGEGLKFRNNELDYPRWAVEQIIDWSEASKLRSNDFLNFLYSLKFRTNSENTLKFIDYFLRNNLTYLFREGLVLGKEKLSDTLEYKFVFQTPPLTIYEDITRSRFEKDIEDFLKATREMVEDTLLSSGIGSNEISRVVLTGGSSLIPAFQKELVGIFGDKLVVFEPFTAVAKGLALIDGK